MTDTQFWRELDKVARKGMTEETVKEFADMLMYGYKNGKNLCVIGLVNQSDRSLVNQLYEGDFDKRLVLCSTTFSKGKCSVLNMEKNNEMGLPSGTEVCVVALPCKFILDNLYYKKQITGLVFNKALTDCFLISADILRLMIEETGQACLPENHMPADKEQYKREIISSFHRPYKSKFESKSSGIKTMSIREWAVKKSPPAYLVILLDGKWDDSSLNDSYAANLFLAQWKNVRKFIEKQNAKSGRKYLEDFTIDHKNADIAEEMSTEFINLLYSVDMLLFNTRHYAELIDFCKDMLKLFENSDTEKSSWIGIIGEAMWELNPSEAEEFFKKHLQQKNDIIMGYYSFRLLNAQRIEEAANALKGYEDSEDETIQERLLWLKSEQEKGDPVLQTVDEMRSVSHNEYVLWTIHNGTLRVAVGVCDQTEFPIVYTKDLEALNEGHYNCYSFYEASLTPGQAKEIIEAAKNGNNRAVPKLIKKYVHPDSSLKYHENIGYAQLTDMVSDAWFDSVKRVMALLDKKSNKGYYEIDVEIEV